MPTITIINNKIQDMIKATDSKSLTHGSRSDLLKNCKNMF